VPLNEDGLGRLVLKLGPETSGCVKMMSGAVWVRDRLEDAGWRMKAAHARKVRDVLGGPPNERGSQATWTFHLLEGPNGTTRLLERGHGVAGKGLFEKLGFGRWSLIDPIGFVMSKKMLRTIKKLAEASRS
jgi:hypothetical protein